MSIPLLNYEVCQSQAIGVNTSTTLGSTFITTGSTNTKMAYTQLVASTPTDISYIILSINQTIQSTAGNAIAVDIAVGAAGSEVVIIPNIVYSWSGTFGGYGVIALPISIPAGSRIAYSFQFSASTGETFQISLSGFTGNFAGVARYDAIGFNAGSTAGTAMSGASSSNTKGSYQQITASTALDYSGLFIVIDTNYQNNSKTWLLDIAVGASGSEIAIIPNIPFCMANGMSGCWFGFIPMKIKAGTRLSGRIQTSSYSSFFERPNVTIYGAVS